MPDIVLPVDDYGYDMNFTVAQANGGEFNAIGYSPYLKVWKDNPASLALNVSCILVNGTIGTMNYAIGATNFADTGEHKAEIELTKTGVRRSTEQFTILVKESG